MVFISLTSLLFETMLRKTFFGFLLRIIKVCLFIWFWVLRWFVTLLIIVPICGHYELLILLILLIISRFDVSVRGNCEVISKVGERPAHQQVFHVGTHILNVEPRGVTGRLI